MAYIGRTTDGFGVRQRFLFTPDAGATSVSGTDASGATLTFSDSVYMDVFLNGVLLKAGTDYNTNTANTIAGLTATVANDEVTVLVYDIFTTADMVSATSGGTFKGDVVVKTDDGGLLTLQTSDTSVTDGDVLGALQFQAPDELGGTDSTTVSAAIVAEADSAFDAATNQTDLVFKLGSSSVATEKMRLTHAGDLELKVDGFDLLFGADGDVNLRHVADTGLLLNSTRQLQFGDSGTYIHQSADGVLDLVSDTEIEINATTIDINGAADISGDLTVAGAFTSVGIDDNSNDTAITIDANEDVELNNGGLYVTNALNSLTVDKGGIDRSGNTTRIISGRSGGNYADFSINIAGTGSAVNRQLYIDYQGNTTLDNGNLVIGTSGKGIDFSATGDGAGTDSSELLDDYEEGTWTATATAYGGTFSVSDEQYVKVGRMVHFDCVVSFSGTDSDRLIIAGLPYTATNTSAVAVYFAGTFYHLKMLVSGTTIVGANQTGDASYTEVSGMTARFSGTYMATA